MENKNIMIAGVGGQGILLAGSIVGEVAGENGFEVKLSAVHGMAQRGGSIVTHIRYGTQVFAPVIEKGQADILVSCEQLEALRYASYLKPKGIVIMNEYRIFPVSVTMGNAEYPQDIVKKLSETYSVRTCEAHRMAMEAGIAKSDNVIMLALLAKELPFAKESWMRAIRKHVHMKNIEKNIALFDAAFEASLCKSAEET